MQKDKKKSIRHMFPRERTIFIFPNLGMSSSDRHVMFNVTNTFIIEGVTMSVS